MSDIRRRLRSPPLTLREAISQHEMIIDSMGALPDAEASHSRGIRPFPLPLSPAVFVSPRGWFIVRPRTVARSTHSIEFSASVQFTAHSLRKIRSLSPHRCGLPTILTEDTLHEYAPR
jgi:hypothetical protein